MRANEFEDILRLYLIDKNLGVSDIESKCGDYYQIEVKYDEIILEDSIIAFRVTQKDNYVLDDDKVDTILLTDILLFIATY